jgi:hypothetical protein
MKVRREKFGGDVWPIHHMNGNPWSEIALFVETVVRFAPDNMLTEQTRSPHFFRNLLLNGTLPKTESLLQTK